MSRDAEQVAHAQQRTQQHLFRAAAHGAMATQKEYFPSIQAIKYEGPTSKNPLAFRHYNPDEIIVRASLRLFCVVGIS